MTRAFEKTETYKSIDLIFNNHWQGDYTVDNIHEFYSQVRTDLTEYIVDRRTRILAYKYLSKFVRHKNKALNIKLPLPPNLERTERGKLGNDRSWFRLGKPLSDVLPKIEAYWAKQAHYSPDERLGWLIYSCIIYGGINQKALLIAYINQLIAQQFKGDAFYDDATLITVTYDPKAYGNGYDANDALQCTQQIIVDNITRLWMVSLQPYFADFEPTLGASSLDRYLRCALSAVDSPIIHKKCYTSTYLCRYANYVWQQLDGVDIDLALTHVLIGKTKTAGLLESDFKRFYQAQHDEKKLKSKNIQPIDLSKLIREKVWQAANQDALASKPPKSKAKASSVLARKLHKDIDNALTKRDADDILQNIAQQTQHALAVRFIAWVCRLLADNTLTKSSIRNYVEVIAEPLLEVAYLDDIDDYDSDDFEDLYEAALERKKDKSITYRANLLNRFHTFQMGKYDAPATDIPYLASRLKVSAQLVSTSLFQALINALDNRLDHAHAIVFKLIFILAYRTGMRKGEILGLSYYDVEHRHSNQPYLIVRANQNRSIKSTSSRRRIDISALLKPSEFALMLDYLALTMPSKDKLGQSIFSLSGSNLPLDDHLPLNLLKTLLEDIIGCEHGFTFHSLRHTAFTNIALVFCGNPRLVAQFTDYTAEDAIRMRTAQFGKNDVEQLGWYGAASIMGHLSPETSFKSYLHLGYVMATYQLYQSSHRLSTDAMANMSGLSKRSIRENLGISDKHIETESVSKLSNLLYRNTVISNKLKPITSNVVPIQPNPKQQQTHWKRFDLYRGYSIGTIIKCLQHIERHQNVRAAAHQYAMQFEDAKYFYTQAQHLISQTTQKKTLRFVSKRLKNDDRVIKLLPPPLSNINDRKLLFEMLYKARELHLDDSDSLKSFVDILEKKITIRNAYVNFREKQQMQMFELLDLGTQLLPEKHWLVHATNEKTKLDILKRYANLPVEVHDTSVNKVGIGFKSANRNQQRQFSTLLRHVAHLLGVLVDRSSDQ